MGPEPIQRWRIWFTARPPDATTSDGQVLVTAHVLDGERSPVVALAPSARTRMLAAAHADGAVELYHVTSGQRLAHVVERTVGAGTRLALGSAVIEVTDEPHTGCAKFSARFGSDAVRFVNSPTGRGLRLRGLNARVVEPGRVRAGDTIRKL